MHTSLGVSPSEDNRTYFEVNTHRIARKLKNHQGHSLHSKTFAPLASQWYAVYADKVSHEIVNVGHKPVI